MEKEAFCLQKVCYYYKGISLFCKLSAISVTMALEHTSGFQRYTVKLAKIRKCE